MRPPSLCASTQSGQRFGNPNPYNLSKKYGSTPPICTAVRPPFVSPYFPGIKLRRKGNPAVRLPFVLQYASHLYGSTPPICTAVLLEKYWGLGSPERFWPKEHEQAHVHAQSCNHEGIHMHQLGVRSESATAILLNPLGGPFRNCYLINYRRGIGVRVQGVTGRDAIVHKRRRNSSQKATQ